MTKKPLDPALAAILDSIRATVGGEEGTHAAPAAPDLAPEPLPSAALNAPPGQPPAPPQQTVEAFLAAMIRPQVEAWLSANLPEIVQRVANDEVRRIVGKN
jgi:hypothetical protein